MQPDLQIGVCCGKFQLIGAKIRQNVVFFRIYRNKYQK